MPRLLLLSGATSYRTTAFMDAARALGYDLLVGSDHEPMLARAAPGHSLVLDFHDANSSLATIEAHARTAPIQGVVGTDDRTVVLAGAAAKRLGLPHNPPDSIAACRDKLRFRQLCAAAGLRGPWFDLVVANEDISRAAARVDYPCVLKPRSLTASIGVIRVNNQQEFITAVARILSILDREMFADDALRRSLMVEGFMPGTEHTVEGMLDQGRLHCLAVFDKPDPLDGPFFEESLLITPSRLSLERQEAMRLEVERATNALGLTTGPIHAELRDDGTGPRLLEMATRTIGGHCAAALRFLGEDTVERLSIRLAVGEVCFEPHTPLLAPPPSAANGVMMIPIPATGSLQGVTGLEAARRVAGVSKVQVCITNGEYVRPLPEGNQYLGFIFATATTTQAVEAALREAHALIRFDIQA